MATLAEINTVAAGGNALADKVKAAILVVSQAIAFESDATANHANRLAWAKQVLGDPNGNADDVLRIVVAHANAIDTTISEAELLALSDATVISYVAAVVDVFASGS